MREIYEREHYREKKAAKKEKADGFRAVVLPLKKVRITRRSIDLNIWEGVLFQGL